MRLLEGVQESYAPVETHSFDEVSPLVQRGAFLAATVPSGAGKTGCINAIGSTKPFDSARPVLLEVLYIGGNPALRVTHDLLSGPTARRTIHILDGRGVNGQRPEFPQGLGGSQKLGLPLV